MIIRYRTTKAPKGLQTTGRGETPAKVVCGISPERAAEYPATPSGFGPAPYVYRGSCVPSVASQQSWSDTPVWTIGTHHRLLTALRALLVVSLRIIIKIISVCLSLSKSDVSVIFRPAVEKP